MIVEKLQLLEQAVAGDGRTFPVFFVISFSSYFICGLV